MTALVTAVFVTSLLGSVHCAGMCGGIVALCVGGRPVRQGPWAVHGAYHLGRLLTYSTLGAASGAIGQAVDFGGSSVGVTRAAAIVAGTTMILFGIGALMRAGGFRLGCVRPPAWMQRSLQRGMAAGRDWPPVARGGLFGALTGLLPCGWLYAFVITSAGTGSVWLGALTMAVFWAGTVPILLAVGVGVQRLAGPLARHVPVVTALALVVVGAFAIFGRLSAPGVGDVMIRPAVLTQNEQVERVRDLAYEELPCCHDQSDR